MTLVLSSFSGSFTFSSGNQLCRKPAVCLGCRSKCSQVLAVEDSIAPSVACTCGDFFAFWVRGYASDKDDADEEQLWPLKAERVSAEEKIDAKESDLGEGDCDAGENITFL